MTRHWWVWIVYGVIFIIVGAGHIVWFATTHDPAIGARFGSTLISLGIIVTAQPFFRTGLLEAVNRQMPAGLLEAVNHPVPAGLPEAVNRPMPASVLEAVKRQLPGQHPSGYSSSTQLRKQQKEEHKAVPAGLPEAVNRPMPASVPEAVNVSCRANILRATRQFNLVSNRKRN